MMHQPRTSLKSGFTIIELLIVIVVIGILAALVIISYNGVSSGARDKALISDAEGVATEVTRYSTKNNGALGGAVAWYSGGAVNPNINFTPSPGNVIDVVANSTDYCIRVYNPGSNKNTMGTAETKESTPGVCTSLAPSIASGGTLSCPTGFIPVPGNPLYSTSDFCIMKYEARQASSTVPISQATGSPWTSIVQTDAVTYSTNVAGCSGCHLVTDGERLTVAQNVLNVASNWSTGTVGSGFIYSGHNDSSPNNALTASTDDTDGYSGTGQSAVSSQRRTLTLSNGEVIWDFAGNVSEWGALSITTGQPGASGYAWREWNAIAGTGSVSPSPFPSFGTPVAAGWTGTNGIGRVYSSSTEVALHSYLYGGDWGGGSNAGITTLALGNVPTNSFTYVGFRVAK